MCCPVFLNYFLKRDVVASLVKVDVLVKALIIFNLFFTLLFFLLNPGKF